MPDYREKYTTSKMSYFEKYLKYKNKYKTAVKNQIGGLRPTTQFFEIPEYRLRSGETFKNLKMCYMTSGTPKFDEKGIITNGVLILHGTIGSKESLFKKQYQLHLYAPGKPLDARKYFLIFVDNIGHGQSSKPSDGLRTQFPKYDYYDMIDLQYRLITEGLKINHLQLVMGVSMGGMHSYLWSILYPNFMDGIMPIVCVPRRIEGRNLLWRRIGLNTIMSDPTYQNGNYTSPPPAFIDFYCLFMTFISGTRDLESRVKSIGDADKFITENKKIAEKIDANDFIYAFDASRNYDPEPHLQEITTRVLAINFRGDALNPEELHETDELIRRIKNSKFVLVDAPYGHMSFDYPEYWAGYLGRFMSELERGSVRI